MADSNVTFTEPKSGAKRPAAKKSEPVATSLAGRIETENEARSAPKGSGSAKVDVVSDIGGLLYDPADDTSPKADKEHGTFRRDFVLLKGLEMTDCSEAVVQEACNFGFRPTGLAKVESQAPHADGYHVVVTWSLPVSDQKVRA